MSYKVNVFCSVYKVMIGWYKCSGAACSLQLLFILHVLCPLMVIAGVYSRQVTSYNTNRSKAANTKPEIWVPKLLHTYCKLIVDIHSKEVRIYNISHNFI